MGVGTTMIMGLIGFFVLAIIVNYLLSIYNGLIMLKNNTRKNWANIDVLLKQRTDLIPNLVSTVQGYMKHEKEAIQMVSEAREKMIAAGTINEKTEAHIELTMALKTILALAENYPRLMANENFLKLQEQLAGIENEIADRRELYNDSVNIYNTRIESIPDVIFTRLLGCSKEEYFKATEEEKEEVEVKLGSS